MKTIEINEVKKIELEILDYFENYCKKNKYIYFLAGGSLLGAIRHKGFIPWDDDIDLYMPRKDYELLINNFNKSNDKYKLLHYSNSKEYYIPFIKIVDVKTKLVEMPHNSIEELGVFIDIFPVDGRPLIDGNYYKIIEIIKKMYFFSFHNESYITLKDYIRLFLLWPFKIVGKQKFAICLDNYAKKFSINNSIKAGVAIGSPIKRDTVNRECFDYAILTEFEGKKRPIPNGFDIILKTLYGDYMKLPPKAEQVNKHNFKAWWR